MKEKDKVIRLSFASLQFLLMKIPNLLLTQLLNADCYHDVSVLLAQLLALNPGVSYGKCTSFSLHVNGQIMHAATNWQGAST